MSQTRILVVEDSPLIRQILVDMLRREPDFEVVGFARDGEEALLRIAELSPDVVTLDLEMPRMDGLECLREFMAVRPIPTIMVSTLTPAWADVTLEALSVGAFDFICKPDNGSISTLRGIREELVDKVRQAARSKIARQFNPAVQVSKPVETDGVVLIASAAGGPRALAELFKGLPQGFSAPVLLSQPMAEPFTDAFVRNLTEMGALPVHAARPGDRIQPGVALLATGMSVEPNGMLTSSKRGSADVLFRTAAESLGPRCIAAVLTGAGNDGATGALAIQKAGGRVFAESEATSAIYGMPKAAVEIGAVEQSFPIEEMGENLAQAVALRPTQKRAA